MATFLESLEQVTVAEGSPLRVVQFMRTPDLASASEGLAALTGRSIESLGDLANPSPPSGPLTALEQDIANQVITAQPTAIAAAIVPPPQNTRPRGLDDASWFSNLTYWLVYRHPQNPWVNAGRAPAPITLSSQTSPWAERWKAIYSYVQLALALGVDNMPPLGMEPTQAEKSTAIFYMLAGGEPGDFEVDPSVIPPPHNKIAPGTVTKTVWATNVVYWLCYVYPSSAWVTSGHAPAPIKIPEDSLWLVVWNRIYTLMSNYG